MPARAQFEAFLDDHRNLLNACLDGLTEEQARRRLVPSRTTTPSPPSRRLTGRPAKRPAGPHHR